VLAADKLSDAIALPVLVYAFKSSGIRRKGVRYTGIIRPGKLAIPANLRASQKEKNS